MRLLALLLLALTAQAQMRVVTKPAKSPLVTLRIVFSAGAAQDPPDKPGVAYLTALMLSDGGTKDLSYRQIADAMFPMAASFSAQVDKEMTTFSGVTHADNLAEYYKMVRARLLEPGWREDDFRRLRDQAINEIKVGLRNNDEELAKEVLYSDIYQGTPYGRYNGGTVRSLEAMTLDDVKQFYRAHYTQANLFLGIAGGYPSTFLEAMKKDFRSLPESNGLRLRWKAPDLIHNTRVTIVEKETRSVAISLGFPIPVTRRHPDYAALLLVASYFGQHRMSGRVLYDELREKRGLNYGDYAYTEYFPQGMYLMEPNPNLARQSQLFQLWIRPVEPANAKFALRMAMYQLDKLLKKGIAPEDFERTRDFLTRYVNFLLRTPRADLGYAIDSLWYDYPGYGERLKAALAKLTIQDIQRALGHLRTDRLSIAIVSNHAEDLKRQLISDDASPMAYNSPKPAEVTETDKIVEKWPLHLRAEDIKIVPVDSVFHGTENNSARDSRGGQPDPRPVALH